MTTNSSEPLAKVVILMKTEIQFLINPRDFRIPVCTGMTVPEF